MNVAIVTSPQHVMNLLQASLMGLACGPISCLVVDYPGDSKSSAREVLEGTLQIATSLLPELSVEYLHLSSKVSHLELVTHIRRLQGSMDETATALVGIYPSILWRRSRLLSRAQQIIFLDDGASSLELDVPRLEALVNGQRRVTRLDSVLGRLAGPVPPPREQPTALLTCFPTPSVPWTTHHHDYSELRALLQTGQTEKSWSIPPGKAVWIDSNFGWLTSEDHEALLKRAVEQFHLDSYVPHRRTPKTFLAVTRLLGLQVVRPPVPVEFAIGAWTAAGSDIYIPPSSLTFTAPFFRTEPGQLHLVPIAKWLKQHRLASHPGVDHAQITLAESHAGTIEEAMTSTEEWVVDTLD